MTAQEVLDGAGLGDVLPSVVRYAVGRRWFGGRGRTVRDARVSDAAVLGDAEPRLLFLLLTISYADGGDDRYNIPLEIHSGAGDAPRPASAFLISEDGVAVYDALGGPEWPALVWRLSAAGACIPTAAGELEFFAAGTSGAAVHPERIRPVGGEQSNTSMVWEEREFLKYVRRVEPGPPIELEMLEALAGEGFANAPRLLGGAIYRARGSPVAAAVALIQSFLTDARDGWTCALDSVAQVLDATDTPLTFAFESEAADLGRVTGAMHRSLGSPRLVGDMAPEVVTTAMLTEWAAGMSAQLSDVLAAGGEAVAALGAVRDRPERAFRALLAAGDGGLAIRTHGDFHLGQVMRTATRWMVLDFEGEPARTTAQRRRRYPPLRDVAGMLRSFDYAAATVLAGRATPGKLDARAGWWADRCRRAFWQAYLDVVEGSGLLPPVGGRLEARRAWEVDKAVYELRYELGHRPDWVGVPLAFLLKVA